MVSTYAVVLVCDEGKPIFEDALSYTGRNFIFSPVFHYIIAFFALFMPIAYAAKIIPNIFAAALVFIVFLLAKNLTRNLAYGKLVT